MIGVLIGDFCIFLGLSIVELDVVEVKKKWLKFLIFLGGRSLNIRFFIFFWVLVI